MEGEGQQENNGMNVPDRLAKTLKEEKWTSERDDDLQVASVVNWQEYHKHRVANHPEVVGSTVM